MSTSARERRLTRFQDDVSYYMREIAKLYDPKSKITLLLRHPDYPDSSRDVTLGDDEIADAVAALQRLAKLEVRK